MSRKRMLLQTCCGPCLSQCLNVLSGRDAWEKILRVKPEFDIAVYFDNPNIYPAEEFDKRKNEACRVINIFDAPDFRVKLFDDLSVLRREEWNNTVKTFSNEPEKGKRCRLCYAMRLEESFRKAVAEGYDAVATTLTLSPWKDTDVINETGWNLSKKFGLEYIETDFKKNDGYKKSAEICSRFGIYRQNYCGCIYSLKRNELNEDSG
jgi:hypothetical protein